MRRSNRFRHTEQSGFALVLSLIIIAVAAVIVVGFLGTAGHDRLTAETAGERCRAELAAQSGLEGAKKALTAVVTSAAPPSKTQNDYFILTTANDVNGVPYYFIGTADGGSVAAPTIQYFPLYSGGSMPSPSPSPFPAPVPTFTGTQAKQTMGTQTIKYPRLFSTAPHSTWQQNIHTSWQVVDNTIPATAEHTRFTYWIEDLAGYVDANVAGNVDDTSSSPPIQARPLGVNPSEIALFTLFAPAAQVDSGSTYAATLVGNHSLLFTPLTTRMGGTAGSSDDLVCLASLAANLSVDSEQNVIPFGQGFPAASQGHLKTNLNTVVSSGGGSAGVTTISNAISTNLPLFASTRQGGFTGATKDYLKTLAANMIDYADSDSTPTVGTNYRGIDLYPFVVEYCDQFAWTILPAFGASPDYYQNPPTTGHWFADITITTFVQVWNMYNTDISSGQVRFVDRNNTGISVEHNGNGKVFGTPTSFNAMDTAAGGQPMQGILDFGASPTPTPNPTPAPTPAATPGPSATPIIAAGTLHANEYKVFQVAQRRYVYDVGTAKPGPAASVNLKLGLASNRDNNDTASFYQVYWQGVLVDQPPSNMTRTATIWDPIHYAAPDFHSTMPALRYSSGNSAPYHIGDPRANQYIQASQVEVPYSNTSWGGRILMQGSPGGGLYANEGRPAYWQDGGHNTATPGASPTGTQPPTSITTSPLESTKAPERISNAGQYSSITELGNIYDPFQQDPFKSSPGNSGAVSNSWKNAWTNGFNAGSANKAMYGSYSSLRIGRPEFKDFDNSNARASRLLDVLSISDRVSTQGKININTASREVLRTLGAGIKFANDAAILPAAVYGPKTATEADLFADSVIAARGTSPFISTSTLATLKTSGGQPVFGNPAVWTSGGPTEWNDAASEEYFAKIFNFATVRSRNFRVFVTGQVYIPANGLQPERVIATANKVYHVFLKPTRDATGAITSQNCQITYSADVF